MPRAAVRFETFVSFAEAFVAEHGRDPSIRAAIAQLGGSATTISAHKRAWRPAAGGVAQPDSTVAVPQLPDAVAAALGEAAGSLLRPLWGELLNEANQRNWQRTVELETQHEVYLEEVEAAAAHAARAQQEKEALEARLDEREAALEALRAERDHAAAERDQARDALATAGGKLSTLADRERSLERELTVERARVSKQSADAASTKSQYEAEIKSLSASLDRAQLRAEDAEEDLHTSRVDGQARLDALAGELAEAHRANRDVMTAMNDLRAGHQDKIAVVHNASREAEAARDDARAQTQRARDSADTLRTQLTEARDALQNTKTRQDDQLDALLDALRQRNQDER